MDIKEEEILGDAVGDHWYYCSKAKAVIGFLGKNKISEVLDIGAGSGIFSEKLIDAGVVDSAVCVDIEYPENTEKMRNGHRIQYVKSVENITQPLLLMMDVVEHIEDDLAFIRSYAEMMPKGSKLLLTAPAFKFLWSGHDEFLGHERRYTLKQLEKVVSDAGLTVVKGRYFFGSLFPLVVVIRFINRLKVKLGGAAPESSLEKHSPFVNNILKYIHDIEYHTLFKINRFAGLSVFCIAEKK